MHLAAHMQIRVFLLTLSLCIRVPTALRQIVFVLLRSEHIISVQHGTLQQIDRHSAPYDSGQLEDGLCIQKDDRTGAVVSCQ